MEQEIKPHQIRSPREELAKSDVGILRDIGNQLGMLEQNAPQHWQQFYKSFLSSKTVSIEKIARRLDRDGETEKLELLYDLLIDASHADYSANDNFEASASELVNEIKKLAA